MKLCVIGNSHVGMLRGAMRHPGAEDVSLTFFAKAGKGIDRATIRGSVISAEDPGLAAAQERFAMPGEIDVDGFDGVIFVAGAASVFHALKIPNRCQVFGWPSQRRMGGDLPLISEAAYVAALADQARAGVSYRFAQALRAASNVPMFLVPQPYPNAKVLSSIEPKDLIFRRIQVAGDGPALTAGLARALDLIAGEIDTFTVLHQPEDTVAEGFLTAPVFTRDAVRVDGATPQHGVDLLHVGPAFGSRVLGRVRTALGLEPHSTKM